MVTILFKLLLKIDFQNYSACVTNRFRIYKSSRKELSTDKHECNDKNISSPFRTRQSSFGSSGFLPQPVDIFSTHFFKRMWNFLTPPYAPSLSPIIHDRRADGAAMNQTNRRRRDGSYAQVDFHSVVYANVSTRLHIEFTDTSIPEKAFFNL